MPAKDVYHNAVKTALIKDGWIITDDPYFIKYKEFKLYVDLAAERTLAAQHNDQKIVVEVKSFISPSFIQDLEKAVGQYIIYRNFLTITAPDCHLYLAISKRTYNSSFRQEAVQVVVEQNQLKLIIVDTDNEVITQWIN